MYAYRLRRNFIRNRTKIMASFVLTTGMTYILLFPNINLQFDMTSYTCQSLDLNQFIQMSVNKPGFQNYTEEMANDLEFLPDLKNPCWFEEFDESDLEHSLNTPYQYPYNPTFTGHQFLFLDDIKKIVTIYSDHLRQNKTTRLRCLPYFYIIGQPKCATSDLYYRLNKHPMIKKGLVKESQWWAWTRQGVILDNGTSLPLELSDLADLFSHPAMEIESMIKNQCENKTNDQYNQCNQYILGDGSIYTWDAAFVNVNTGKRRGTKLPTALTTPEYIKWLIPSVKLIVMARHPAERLYSAYKYFNKNKQVSNQLDFHVKVVQLLARFNSCKHQKSALACAYDKDFRTSQDLLISDSLYGLYVKEWLRVIGPENLLIIRTEDYKSHRRETLRETFRFLGLCDLTPQDEDAILNMDEVNKGQVDIGPMLPVTRQILNDFFRPYNEMMVEALNDERFYWDDYD
ncbi:hypothetical protein CHUAL_007232 [Chamberlinius hualienensis]